MHLPIDSPTSSSAHSWRTTALYVVLLVGSVGGFLLLRAWGETLPPPAADPVTPARRAPTADVLPRVLLALAVILVACRLVNGLFRRIGQPPVIG
jgi:hypothetical protein